MSSDLTTITINLTDADLRVLDSRRGQRSRQGWIRAAIHTAAMPVERGYVYTPTSDDRD